MFWQKVNKNAPFFRFFQILFFTQIFFFKKRHEGDFFCFILYRGSIGKDVKFDFQLVSRLSSSRNSRAGPKPDQARPDGPAILVSPTRPWPGRACEEIWPGPARCWSGLLGKLARPGPARPCRHPCSPTSLYFFSSF